MVDSTSAKTRLAPVACALSAGLSRGLPAPPPRPSAFLLPPSSLRPGLLTVQVAAWDGRLLTPAFSDHQEQQAGKQGLGGRHGHLKHSGQADVCRWTGSSLKAACFQVNQQG